MNLNLENAKKVRKIFSVSEINACENFAINCFYFRKEYLSSAVNGLTNSPKILHIIKREFFQLNFLQRDQ